MKHVFIINPIAGNGKDKDTLLDRIHAAASSAGIDYKIYFSRAVGDAEAYTRAVASKGGHVRFYACGGDGTFNEVVNGAIPYRNAELTMVPSGNGNDFPRSFQNKAQFSDIARQIRGRLRPIDAIKYNDRYCVNMLNMGFDCAVVANMEKWRKHSLFSGPMFYGISVARTLAALPTEDLTVKLDTGEEFSGKFLLVAVGNGAYYGGGYHAAPLAALDDGLMEVNLISPVGRISFMRLIGDYKAGKIYENPIINDKLVYRRCASLTLTPAKKTNLCADGEIEKVTDVKIEICPKAVRLTVPMERR